jgi:chitodextrinase
MNFTTPYNTSDYFFTKDDVKIFFDTPLLNTYFEMIVNITSFEFYTEQSKSKTLTYKIPLFGNKASFLLGEIIDRSMPRMHAINLRSLFQYKAAQVNLTVTEVDYETGTVLNAATVGPIKFISGYTPQVVQNNCAFLDLYRLSRRVTTDGYAFFNMILTPGTHNFKVYKNDLEVDTFDITVSSGNIISRALKLSDYAANLGDVIELRMTDNPTVSKVFYLFPKTIYSNYIAFEDEYRLKTVIEFTGEYKFNPEFSSKFNKVQNGAVEANRKISSKTDLEFMINTGWLLKDEEILIESLLGSLRGWLIIGENQGIEIVPNPKKMAKLDPTTALYSYDVEFMVNPENAKPLLLEMDKALVILEVDDIAPTAPSNLRKESATNSNATIAWDASTDLTGVTGYDIYKNGVFEGSTTSLRYVVYSLAAATNYSFFVKAKDEAGNISVSSNVLALTTASSSDTTPPTKPINLTAQEITASSLRLYWSQSTDNVGIERYNIYKNSIKIGQSYSALNYLVDGLSPDTLYAFYINAQDAAGNRSISTNKINATTLAIVLQSFYMSDEGLSTANAACSLFSDTLRYHDGDSSYPIVGNTIYSDTQNLFVGFNHKYLLDDYRWVEINNNGLVVLAGNCRDYGKEPI